MCKHILVNGTKIANRTVPLFWYHSQLLTVETRALRYDEIKSLSFHIMFYRLFRGVAKYIVYGNNFSSFG